MADPPAEKPSPPDLPQYLRDPLETQSPERLDAIATYATELAAWKRAQRRRETQQRRDADAIDDSERTALAERNVSTDPDDYEDVPASGAYITIKETRPGYRYYYWQWRDGDSWANEYIAPVSPRE